MKDVMILTGAGQNGMAIARTIAKIMNDEGFDVEPVEMEQIHALDYEDRYFNLPYDQMVSFFPIIGRVKKHQYIP